MPRVIVTAGAGRSLERCRQFLKELNPNASMRAGQTIREHLALLQINPDVGRPLPETPELRELVIKYGDTGYAALYRHDPSVDAVYVLAFRHQKEAGYL